jgi:hypothetical protein
VRVDTGTNEESIKALKTLPDDPEAVFKEGFNAASKQPGNSLDKVGVRFESKEILVVQCANAVCDSISSMKTLPNAESAIDFLQENQSWHAANGVYSKNGIVLYPTSTSSTYYQYQEGMGLPYMKAESGIGPKGTTLSGAENVVRVLAHETGHYHNYSHGPEMWKREYKAIQYYRNNNQ